MDPYRHVCVCMCDSQQVVTTPFCFCLLSWYVGPSPDCLLVDELEVLTSQCVYMCLCHLYAQGSISTFVCLQQPCVSKQVCVSVSACILRNVSEAT